MKLNAAWKEEIEGLRTDYPDVQFVESREGTDGGDAVADANVIVGGKLSREVVERARALELIIVPFAGISHLPLDLVVERNVRVANCHGNARYVAERTVGMILAFYGKIIEYHNDLRRGRWHGFWVGQGLDDTWESVDGKTVAILGAGHIGHYIARFLRPFDVRIVGFKRRRVETLPEHYDEMYYDLDEAVQAAEIVVIVLPATSETTGLFDANRLATMEGKLLVNIGRGSIVEEEALYEALKTGTLRGACIDTWYRYPKGSTEGTPSAYPVHELDNIVLSPHAAGFTWQSVRNNLSEAMENLRRYLKDGDLLNETTPRSAY
jgi:phosphoglycerate dehydrogenase-like enzyme